ncbi:SH3 domain-containing kinase-binding protein 1-like isoform X2 [Vanessa atalanta]|uniref:SH3 domain-containing kinase-binding protein 1-like isoform X2 n=1 Tax=Vanessa atalanta TaxID=42275 RepID=UPI001FCE2536|nr:SH3 domain-containing kinase-binding protein 1-like isoform X2 [Vanessa atalanta]
MESIANQKVSCIVNFAYDALEPDELTVRPGDILRDVERLPGGWWKGELRGRRGMFPDNFVSVLTEHNNARSGVVPGRCRAVFSYQPANPDELPLCVGDVLEVLGEVEEGWWQGRRAGRSGVFPSNFVVMLEPPPAQPAPAEPAPALPPKPVKEQCRVLFPYSAVNDDELSLSEGDIVNIVSKDAPDRGWWKGELHGRVGLFPDNFVQLLPAVAQEVEEKKPDRPPAKTNPLYPVLNKFTEKTASVKELTTSKVSMHKENTLSKESSTQSTVTHTNKSESEKVIQSETVIDGTLEHIKKPPVPLKKSPTPTSGVGGLFSGLKSKIIPSSEKTEKSSTTVSSGSSSSGEWDRTDGSAASKSSANSGANTNSNANANANTATTFDHIERNSILNDPRAGRVKAPRRRPPSQALRDDTHVGLTNGHEVPSEKPGPEKAEEIKPRTREWEKHKAPWMEELKLNQAKKTSFGSEGKSRSVSTSSEASGIASKAGGGSTDRILECGLEEKRSSHSMEMSKSTSSISNRISVLESLELSIETKSRQSAEPKKDVPPELPTSKPPTLQSPTAAGRTIISMLDEIKKPPAPPPPGAPCAPSAPSAPSRPSADADKLPSVKPDKPERLPAVDKHSEISSISKFSVEKSSAGTTETSEMIQDRTMSSSTLERRFHSLKTDKAEGSEVLIAQLNDRILNLEKLLEVQNAKFNAAIEDLTNKLKQESDKRQALQLEIEKLAHCVTQV